MMTTATETMQNDDLDGYRDHHSGASYLTMIEMSKGACLMEVKGFDMRMNIATSRRMMLCKLGFIRWYHGKDESMGER